MRVSANLSLFFHDHRSLARIGVSKTFKTIKDIELRLTEIFKISNFYLKCDNHFLHSSEDISVLNNDDVIWVVPCDQICPQIQSSVVNTNTGLSYPVETIIEPREVKKKHKRKQEVSETEEVEVKSSKKKQKKVNPEEMVKEETDIEVKSIRKSKKKSVCSIGIDEKDSFKNLVKFDKDLSTGAEIINSNEKVSENNEVKANTSKIHFKPALKILPNKSLDDERPRVNIVKTIIIHNKQETPQVDSVLQNGAEEKMEIEGVEENPSSLTKTNSVSSMGQTTQSVTNDSNTEADIESQSTDFSNIDHKRKRKRVRKRKSKNQPNLDDTVSPLPNNFHNLVPRPLLTKARPVLHLRFNDNVNGCENKGENTCEVKNGVENEAEESSQVVTSEEQNGDTLTKISSSYNSDLGISEDFILKQPITLNIEPRVGDFIAFKVFRLSLDYTPEISSNIVGRVVDYDAKTKSVTFSVIYGKDQCAEPDGKFSLKTEEDENDNEKSEEVCDVVNFMWFNLIEPRLLFP